MSECKCEISISDPSEKDRCVLILTAKLEKAESELAALKKEDHDFRNEMQVVVSEKYNQEQELAELRDAVAWYLEEYRKYKEVFRVREADNMWAGARIPFENAEQALRTAGETK